MLTRQQDRETAKGAGQCERKPETGTRFGNVALLVVFHSLQEDVEEADQVCGPGPVFRVELDAGGTGGGARRQREANTSPRFWWNHLGGGLREET